MHRPAAKTKITFDPDASLRLLIAVALLIAVLLGWLALRLLLGVWGQLKGQQGIHLIADNCMLLLTSPDLADRLFAYSMIAGLLGVLAVAIGLPFAQLRRTSAAIGTIHQQRRPLPDHLAEMVDRIGLTGRVTLVENNQLLAFCYGAIASRICISTALLGLVASPDELEAILLHEGYHLLHHDPLKMAIASALAHAFFFLPVASDLYQHYLAMRELAADQEAVAVQRTPKPLAAALYHLASVHRPPTTYLITANVIDRVDGAVMNARFDALLGVADPYRMRLSTRKMAISATFIASTTLLLALTYAAHNGLALLTLEHWLEGFC